MRHRIIGSAFVLVLLAVVCWPIQSAPRTQEIPELAAARAALDAALELEQTNPTKEAALAVDQALRSYHAAVSFYREEIASRYRALERGVGTESLSDPGLVLDPAVGALIRDHQALRALIDAQDPTLALEPLASGVETEPNGAPATANPIATLDPCSAMAGAISAAGDFDWFSFAAAAGDRVWVVADTGSPPPQLGASTDSVLNVFAPDGITPLETDDDDGTGNGGDGTVESTLASVIAGRTLPGAGTYFLRLLEFNSDHTLDPYRLHTVLTNASHEAPEVEVNGAPATANRIIPAGRKVGVRTAVILPLGDVDYYFFPANFGDRVMIVADGDPERDGISTNIDFRLIAPDGVTVLVTADSSTNSGGFTGEGLVFNVTAPGTYFVRVDAPGASGSYHVMASNCTSSFCVVNADCSDGNVCTDDICNPDGSCSNPNNAAPCDDGLFCNGADTCSAGTCSVHPGDPCAAGVDCNNICDEIGDTCFSPFGTPCGDPSDTYCTDPDLCDGAGICRPIDRPDGTPCVGACTNSVCTGGVCSGPTGSTCLAPTLYGSAYSGADGLAGLYRIDSSSGAFALIGPIGFERVSAIDFGPDGRLYGVGERNDGTDTNVLIVIDTATGAGTEIGPTGVLGLGFGDAVADISFRKSDGRLYAYLEAGDGLGVIDAATGAAAAIGFTGIFDAGNGMAFSRGNVLYQAGGGSLTTINQATAAKTVVAPLSFVGFPGGFLRVNGMDAEPTSGVLFGSVNSGSGGGGPSFLATLDTATGVVSHIGLTVSGLDAIAWQPNRCPTVLYGASHDGATFPSTLHRIDPNTGAAVPVGPIGFNGVGGMDFHPVTRALYAVAKRPADQANVLIRIDPLSGLGAEVGPLVNAGLPPNAGGLFDVSFRSDGRLFLSANDPGSVPRLFTVNLTTGLATAAGPTGVIGGGNALGFTLSDALFQATTYFPVTPNDKLYLLDQTTGAATLNTAIGYAGFPLGPGYRSNAMDVDPSSGVPYVVVNGGGGGSGPTYLGTLDVPTGVIRRIGLTVPGLEALAWLTQCEDPDPCTLDECVRCEDAEMYGAAYTGPDGLATLYRINPATGEAAAIGGIGFQRVSAIDYDEKTGLLYATGERNDGSNTNVLLVIDPATGAGTEIGPTGIGGLGFQTEPDISFRNSDGRLYAYLDLGDGVATLDRLTGAATFLGSSGVGASGNGLEFSRSDGLFLVDGNSIRIYTLDQSTGAASAGPAVSYVGFPPPSAFYRVNAMDVNCAGTFYGIVNDSAFGGGGPRFLATVDVATGVVRNIGPTAGGLDAITWRTTRGFCRHTFVDTDADTVCDGLDCAPGDPTAFAVPSEVTFVAVQKVSPTHTHYTHTVAGGGSGTTHDAVLDLVTALPVGPGGGEGGACDYPGTVLVVSFDPPLRNAYWLVARGQNACGPGSYGNTHTNPGPPLNGPPRTTTSCP